MKIKKIWSYWDGPMPDINKMCFLSWKKQLLDWDIKILNKDTIKNYNIIKPNNYESLTSTTKSDIIRSNLLYIYGGVWMDASIYLTENLNWLESYNKYPLMGFKLNTTSYMENWFIAVFKKESKIIKLWLDTLISILNTKPMSMHPAMKEDPSDDYFMMYKAYLFLLKTNTNFKTQVENIPFIKHKFFHWYTPFIPIDKNEKLVKFTKTCRKNYKFIKYPMGYIYIIILIVIILVIVLTIKYSRKIY